ncbi:MAG: beta-lactamase family protein [Aureispira sp.]|nr:beta-lactamase family protein [Aureispira sp.]
MWKYIVVVLCLGMIINSCNNDASVAEAPPKKSLKELEEEHFENTLAYFEQFVQAQMDTTHLPGAAVSVIRNGKVVFLGTYGVVKVGTKDSVDKHTVFRLASVSKGFASTLAGLYEEEGLLEWDNKIVDFLPNFRLRKKTCTNGICVSHVLSHSTGLVEHACSRLIQKNNPYSVTFRGLRSAPIVANPGETYAYQNAIYSVIEPLLEKVTKESYEDLLQKRIFEPLNMDDASVGYQAMVNTENRTVPHVWKNRSKKWVKASLNQNWYTVAPAAGVNASISDMNHWMLAMLGYYPEVISPRVRDSLFTPRIPIEEGQGYYHWHPKATSYYGLGWRVFDYGTHQLIYHGGMVKGYRPELAIDPTHDIGVALLTNGSGDRDCLSDTCIQTFFNMYYDEHPRYNQDGGRIVEHEE